MEDRHVGGESPKHSPQRIRRQWIETGMLQQGLNPLQSIGSWCRCLQGKPCIENHRLLLPALVEAIQGLITLRDIQGLQRPQSSPSQRH